MACADVDMDIQGDYEGPDTSDCRTPPRIQHYKATELMPDDKVPLHDLLKKQPDVLGMVSGILSVGLGIIFAATQEIGNSLFTLFRVSQLTGTLFIVAGFTSNLLFKYPKLLPVSLVINCGCIVVAVLAACLISVDLAHWTPQNSQEWKMELMELCVLGLEVILSAILCFWFAKEKRATLDPAVDKN